MNFLALLLAVAHPQPMPAKRAIEPGLVYSDTGKTIDFPGGIVELYSPLEFTDRDDVQFNGNGTTLLYKGPPTKAVIQFSGMCRAHVRNLKLQIEGPGVTAFILVTNLPVASPAGRVSTANRFSDIWLDDGGKQHPPLYGFDVDSTANGGADRNNDIHMFERCQVYHYNRAAWHFKGTQVHQVTMDGCRFLNVHTARNTASGVWCELGASLSARNCTAWSNAIDFELGARPTALSVQNFHSEHSKVLFDHGTPYVATGAKGQIAFRDVEWRGEPVLGKPAFNVFGLGPIVMESVVLGGINGVAPTVLADGRSELVNGSYRKKPGTLIAKGVIIQQWHGGTWANPSSTFRVPATWQFSGDGLVFGRVESDGRQPDSILSPERY